MTYDGVTRQAWECRGRHGNRLVGDLYLPDNQALPDRSILLLHGGGQTRHAWSASAAEIARAGYSVIALDQRGHGDSDWDAAGRYAFADYGADAGLVAEQLSQQGKNLPVVVGASLGGLASLLAQGASGEPVFSAMVFVDITPHMRADGVSKIESFMRHQARDGFSSLDEAADAVARYLPHRPRPVSAAGLAKNLRMQSDGRYYWHWDPKFLDGPRPVRHNPDATQMALNEACNHVTQPALVIRGRQSELIEESHVEEFRTRIPHLKVTELENARHMVAGDQNDAFAGAVLQFLERLDNRI